MTTRTASNPRHPRPARSWRLPSLTAVAAAALTGLLALGPATSAAGASDPAAIRDTLAAAPDAGLLEDVAPWRRPPAPARSWPWTRL